MTCNMQPSDSGYHYITSKYRLLLLIKRVPSGQDPRLPGKVIQSIFFSKIPKDNNNYIAGLHGHIIMKRLLQIVYFMCTKHIK